MAGAGRLLAQDESDGSGVRYRLVYEKIDKCDVAGARFLPSEAPDDPRQPDPGARPRCRTRPVPGAGPMPKDLPEAAHSR